MRFLIVNPNTSRATNARIGAIAAPLFREPDAFEVVSAPSGIELIETAAQSNATVPAVLSVVEQRHEGVDAIVIAAFSDPGLAQAREAASCPVFAISEAAMKTAARMADRFAIVTLGAELRDAIEANAAAYGVAGRSPECASCRGRWQGCPPIRRSIAKRSRRPAPRPSPKTAPVR